MWQNKRTTIFSINKRSRLCTSHFCCPWKYKLWLYRQSLDICAQSCRIIYWSYFRKVNAISTILVLKQLEWKQHTSYHPHHMDPGCDTDPKDESAMIVSPLVLAVSLVHNGPTFLIVSIRSSRQLRLGIWTKNAHLSSQGSDMEVTWRSCARLCPNP